MTIAQDKIRNIAIIAHVDHGKTTLVDAFLKQSNLFRDNQDEMNQEQILDSGDLEREKGITIKAKNIAIRYKADDGEEYKINIIDTPGHADFGGEVERTLNMADGCLLLVDAQEGPMPQTKFVLKRALELGLNPMVVINKIDKKNADIKKVINRVNDLFLNLATHESQLNFPVFYAIAREGKVFDQMPEGDLTVADSIEGNVKPMLEAIVKHVPAPSGSPEGPFQLQISSLELDSHTGRYLIGKVKRGKIKAGDNVVIVHGDQPGAGTERGSVKKLMVREGLAFVEVPVLNTGEIGAIIGIESTAIGGTICPASQPDPLPLIKISSPSVKIKFEASTSPLVGKEGKFVTAKQIQQRLEKESEINISLKITKGDAGSYFVAGRGELQLSILIETMRREGYEFQIRRPEVILQEIDGIKCEPMEELMIDVPEEYIGTVTGALSERNAEMLNLETENGSAHFEYKILTRNLLGLRSRLITETRGNLVMNNFLLDYVPFTTQPEIYRKGVLISMESGVSMGYSLNTLQERGDLFIGGSEQVYEGMIVGINKFDQDMEVNVTKEREKSGVRIKHDEITQTSLKTPIKLTLEYALVFLAKDEMLEVTPKSLRLRKIYLTKTERDWAKRTNLTDVAKTQLGLK